MEPFQIVRDKTVLLLREDLDTAQLLPHRYMLLPTKAQIAEKLFADLRNAESDFPLNDPSLRERKILVVGDNFGCGSSREHAVWAIAGWPFRAVVGMTYGDIFKNSCVKNGLLLVELSRQQHEELVALLEEQPDLEIAIDLPAKRVVAGNHSFDFDLDDFSHELLVSGQDELQYLLNMKADIERFEREKLHPLVQMRMTRQ